MASKTIKMLLLLLLLGVPVLIYLFLQGFGENQYTLPIYYEEGIPDSGDDCATMPVPHTLSDFIEIKNCQNGNCAQVKNKVVLFNFVSNECSTQSLEAIARITNQYKDKDLFHTVTVFTDSETTNSEIASYSELYNISENSWSWWDYQASVPNLVKCGFNLSMNCELVNQAVLLDQNQRIRGYYSTTDAEELDRIATEIAILLTDKSN